MKDKKMKNNQKKIKIKRINRKNKKQKLRKPKNRLQAKEDLMRKELAQHSMSYLEILNLELFFLKNLSKAVSAKSKIDTPKKYNF
jgi:hypothetical protein